MGDGRFSLSMLFASMAETVEGGITSGYFSKISFTSRCTLWGQERRSAWRLWAASTRASCRLLRLDNSSRFWLSCTKTGLVAVTSAPGPEWGHSPSELLYLGEAWPDMYRSNSSGERFKDWASNFSMKAAAQHWKRRTHLMKIMPEILSDLHKAESYRSRWPQQIVPHHASPNTLVIVSQTYAKTSWRFAQDWLTELSQEKPSHDSLCNCPLIFVSGYDFFFF